MTIPVTIVIPVKNEERNLGPCLARLKRFAHILVVDSGSTDATESIARDHGAEWITFNWDGRYPKKRNWVLLTHRFDTPWVLFLDADEMVSEGFCDALERELPGSDQAGYWLNYTNYFMGRRLRHGIAQRKLALIRVGAGLYEKIEEEAWSSLDMEVHEHPVLDGPVGEIAEPIDHRDFRGVGKFLSRHIEYARWEASRWRAIGSGLSDQPGHFTGRQRFKYRNLGKWWYPCFYFLFCYFVRLGFLDGRAGYLYAFYKAWYFETIRAMIEEDGRRDAPDP